MSIAGQIDPTNFKLSGLMVVAGRIRDAGRSLETLDLEYQ